MPQIYQRPPVLPVTSYSASADVLPLGTNPLPDAPHVKGGQGR